MIELLKIITAPIASVTWNCWYFKEQLKILVAHENFRNTILSIIAVTPAWTLRYRINFITHYRHQ